VSESGGLLRQGKVLAGLWVDRLDLAERKQQPVAFLRPGRCRCRELVELGAHLPQLGIGPPIGALGAGMVRTRERPGVGVERLELPPRAEQIDLVGLTVQADEVAAEFGEQADRDRRTAEVGPGPTLVGDRTHGQQLVAVGVGAGIGGTVQER
jgi:hypothetical protein